MRQPTEVVADFGLEFQHFIDDMIETMRGANGIGLAAPQVGKSQKIIVCEFAGDKESKLPPIPLTVLCNPAITDYSKVKKNMVEGCLSFPGIELLIKRPKKVTVKGVDRYGKKIEIKADNLYARVLQHEIDHLDGVLLPDRLQQINVIFIGTGTLGLPSLEAMAKDPQYTIKLVVTGEVEGKKSRREVKNPVLELARKHNLPILAVKNINDPEITAKIKRLKPDIGIMADFGQIIQEEVLNIPKHGIVNIHPSLLPRHRGPSPVQQTILDGDEETGVSLILTGKKMDAGGVIAQASAKLTGSETTSILKDYLAKGGASLLLNSIPYYIAGDLKPETQDEKKAAYTHLFTKTDGLVDKESPAIEVERKIRAFCEWPKVTIIKNNKSIQLLAAHLDPEGRLVIDRVKPEGKQEMSYEEYLRGYKTALTFKG